MKVVIEGRGGSGKTALCYRIVNFLFLERKKNSLKK